jgi:hypothetical protein
MTREYPIKIAQRSTPVVLGEDLAKNHRTKPGEIRDNHRIGFTNKKVEMHQQCEEQCALNNKT